MLALLAYVCACGGWTQAVAAPAVAQPASADVDFGVPPSGVIPILFNDRTVYAKPDIVTRKRVLAAFVAGGRIYMPLGTMFAQMGAAVSASADGRTILATKNGAAVSLTVGKHQVVVNGESRPLDVPPKVYKGIVFVPVRVIAEALGAYVLWVPERRIVVVRYVPTPVAAPLPPEPTPAPVSAPTVAPTAAPTATRERNAYRGFVQGAIAAPRDYNEFSAGQWCPQSFIVSAGYMFRKSPFALKADYRKDVYVTSDNLTNAYANHYTRLETIDGGIAYTPVFRATQSDLDARLEYRIASPGIYAGASYLQTYNNYGYARLGGAGLGIEKLPELRRGITPFGSLFYYPSASGNYTVDAPASSNFGKTYRQRYQIVKYDVGLSLGLARFPVYLYGGFNGERYAAKLNAPIGQTHDGPYIGLGFKL